MDAVTAEAGVSKQTLYAYFPTKVDLLSEIVAAELARLNLGVMEPPLVQSRDDIRAALLGFAAGFTKSILQPDSVAILRIILGELFHIPELRHSFRDALPARLLTETQQLIRAAHERGVVNAPNPDLSARMFIGALMTFVALDGFLGDGSIPSPSQSDLEYITDAFLTSVAVDR